jgi:hypothetical protein
MNCVCSVNGGCPLHLRALGASTLDLAKLATDFREYIEAHHDRSGGHFDCDECSMIAELTGIIHGSKR